jgi:hypothetical protein
MLAGAVLKPPQVDTALNAIMSMEQAATSGRSSIRLFRRADEVRGLSRRARFSSSGRRVEAGYCKLNAALGKCDGDARSVREVVACAAVMAVSRPRILLQRQARREALDTPTVERARKTPRGHPSRAP